MLHRPSLPHALLGFCAGLLTLLGGALLAVPPAIDAPAPNLTPATEPKTQPAPVPADQPSPRMKDGKPDAGWMSQHEGYVALAKKGDIDLYFVGDSITDGWHRAGKAVWDKEFVAWKPGNFGIGGDQTQHVLYRLENGELDGVTPKVFVLMIGTNNSGTYTAEQIAAGVAAIIKKIQGTNPQAKVLLLAIFPRGATPEDTRRQRTQAANQLLAKLDDGKNVKFMDIGAKFLDARGVLSKQIMPDLLHPNEKGYQIWADAMKPILTEWLGPPAGK